jgi:hypothetical protein
MPARGLIMRFLTQKRAWVLLGVLASAGCAKWGWPRADSPNIFSLVVLPDTQCYTSNGSPPNSPACGKGAGRLEMFESQIDWIVRNRQGLDVAAVVGLGDIVQCNSEGTQWSNALSAYAALDQSGIPYAPVSGNHDYDTCDFTPARIALRYNASFGPLLRSHGWFGTSSYPAGAIDNFFISFERFGQAYLVIALEFYPRQKAVEWARGVMAAHPTALVIVTTHAFLKPDGLRPVRPAVDGYSPEDLWNSLVKEAPNVIAVVSGHFANAARRTDLGTGGNRIPQMLSNYQWYSEGGSGYLRILTIDPARRTIDVRTYSPYLNHELVDDASRFVVEYGS